MIKAASPTIADIRTKGQVWTPAWVADAMAAYALGGGASELFDPACGAGALLAAGRRYAEGVGRKLETVGMDIDPAALAGFVENGLSPQDAANIRIADYTLHPPARKFQAISVNPPYLRHHRIGEENKAILQRMIGATTGMRIDARAGLHVYFLVRALAQLAPGGRLSFIVSSDICEGVFATNLWKWVLKTYRLDAVLTFDEAAAPFPQADTNALVFFLCNEAPAEAFSWAVCRKRGAPQLVQWVAEGFPCDHDDALEAIPRTIAEGQATGLSRTPVDEVEGDGLMLGDVAKVMRGIASGANDFFFLTRSQADRIGIPEEFLRLCIGRVRDVPGDEITKKHMGRLDQEGRPTLLLSLPDVPAAQLPKSLRDYLAEGEAQGLHELPLIRTRRPWYRMEHREPPPFLFAYLGRRDCRFIRNTAGVVPLSCLLCVYPKPGMALDNIQRAFNHPETIANLQRIGKTYGNGAVKVEPKNLGRLRLAAEAQGWLGSAVEEMSLFSGLAKAV